MAGSLLGQARCHPWIKKGGGGKYQIIFSFWDILSHGGYRGYRNHCQHRLLARVCPRSSQMMFVPYFPISSRGYTKQIPRDNISDKLHCQHNWFECRNSRWHWMAYPKELEPKGAIPTNVWPSLITQINVSDWNCLQASIQGHLRFWHLRQLCWWCLP